MAMTVPTEDQARYLQQGITRLLQEQIAVATEDAVKVAVADFEQRLRKSIATVALDVASFYELSRNGPNVVITVKDIRK